jgi:voltage-gated potassium channel
VAARVSGATTRPLGLSGPGRTFSSVAALKIVERQMSRFLRKPVSVRAAASVIVTATAVVVVAGGVLIRLLDPHEFPNIWLGMWWALQTATTVGYGDVTPKDVSGRIVAAFVMLQGVAFIAIITAAITSTFVARAQREHGLVGEAEEEQAEERLDARFDELAERLDRLETMLRKLTNA